MSCWRRDSWGRGALNGGVGVDVDLFVTKVLRSMMVRSEVDFGGDLPPNPEAQMGPVQVSCPVHARERPDERAKMCRLAPILSLVLSPGSCVSTVRGLEHERHVTLEGRQDTSPAAGQTTGRRRLMRPSEGTRSGSPKACADGGQIY